MERTHRIHIQGTESLLGTVLPTVANPASSLYCRRGEGVASRGLLESFLEAPVGTMSGAVERGGRRAGGVITVITERVIRGGEEAGCRR